MLSDTSIPGPTVIPSQAGIQIATLDSRLRGNDGTLEIENK
ncbi:MAG: hypothetical protein ACK50J_05920 [Planctomyces sp.]